MIRIFTVGVAIVCFSTSYSSAQTLCQASINSFNVHTVYITGDQYNAVAWGYKHLSEESCLTPVQDISKADAILDLYNPTPGVSTPKTDPITVSCSDSRASSVCTDSNGNVLTTTCSVSGCSSYYGPNPLHLVGQAAIARIANSNLAAEARLYTVDHKLLWQSTDQHGDHIGSTWADKLRLGTNSPMCHVGLSQRHDYKTYRHWASVKCGVVCDPPVDIDLKLQAKESAAHNEDQDNQQMVENAKAAALKLRKSV